jgi:hypothetical protein
MALSRFRGFCQQFGGSWPVPFPNPHCTIVQKAAETLGTTCFSGYPRNLSGDEGRLNGLAVKNARHEPGEISFSIHMAGGDDMLNLLNHCMIGLDDSHWQLRLF